MAQIAWQVFCNIAVVTNTLPNTGISLPFFSSGGTSLILLLAEMGVMINIGRGGERARLERENLRAQREQREKEKSDNTIRLDPNMGSVSYTHLQRGHLRQHGREPRRSHRHERQDRCHPCHGLEA